MQTQDLISCFQVVEDAIKLYNLNPKDAIGEQAGIWNLTKGRAQTRIMVWQNQETGIPYVRVVCPVVAIPNDYKNYDLLNEFLEMNAHYIGVKFVRSENSILLGVDKEMVNVDSKEMFTMIDRVLNVGAIEIPRLEEKYSNSIKEYIEANPSSISNANTAAPQMA